MTDRELLKLAAKAAGIELAWIEYECAPRNVTGFHPLQNVFSGDLWNPLTDDGDALRLAVRLGLRIGVDKDSNITHVQKLDVGLWITEPHNNDPYTSTRRAIVRAAAEIGKGMK